MGVERLFRRRPEPEPERRFGSWWNLAGVPGLLSASAYGLGTSTEQALRNSASWACINVLADAFSRTPIDVVRGEGVGRQQVTPTPTLVARPSGVVLPDVWRFQLGWSLVTDGNAFGDITSWTSQVYPGSVELLDPCDVTERKVVGGIPQVKVGNQVRKLYPHGDLWHVPGRTVPAGSPFALSPVDYAKRAIGTSLSAEDYSYRFFDEGGHPSSILYSSANIDAVQAQVIKDAWKRATTGSREVAVLGADLKHETVQTPPGETQFIDTERFAVEQVCRFWGVPPGMVFGSISGESVTYANVTDADLNFLKHSLDVYYVRLEHAMSDLLPRPQFVRANRNAILRSSPKERYETNSTRLANREATINELRALDDLPGFGPEFDVPGIPPFAPPMVAPASPGGSA